MADKFYKGMWLVAAWHNFIGGVLFIIFGNWVYTSATLPPPVPGIHYQTWIGLIFVFGIAYYLVYRDMYGNKNLVIIGILGKFVSATPMLVGLIFSSGQTPPLFVIPIFTDMTFGVLFVLFYIYATRNDRWKTYAT